MVFWLSPRYQAGGPRWSKTAIRCKLPVLQHGHLGKKGFFSAFSNTFTCSFSCKICSFCSFPSTTQKTVMTDFDKAFGQNMQRKTPDKFLMRQCHLFFNARYSVILISKSHVFIVNALDSMVANGDFMGVSSQIFHHRLWTSKRFLSKNNPRFFP